MVENLPRAHSKRAADGSRANPWLADRPSVRLIEKASDEADLRCEGPTG